MFIGAVIFNVVALTAFIALGYTKSNEVETKQKTEQVKEVRDGNSK